MKLFYIILLVIVLIFCTGFSEPVADISVSYQPNTDRLETLFKASLPIKSGIMYTKVPRGLIVSINEKYFFNEGETKIKESSLCLLDIIAELLVKLSNYCVVEDHTEEFLNGEDNWELSLLRASNIVDYLITYEKIPASQLFSLGYGQSMPFRDNVSSKKNGLDSRIDFVILQYDVKR